MGFIVSLIVFVICLLLLKKVVIFLLGLIAIALGAVVALLGAIPAFLGYLVERVAYYLNLREKLEQLLAGLAFFAAIAWVFGEHRYFDEFSLASFKYILSAGLFVLMIKGHKERRELEVHSVYLDYFDEKSKWFHLAFFVSFFVLWISSESLLLIHFIDISSGEARYLGLFYWILGLVIQLCAVGIESGLKGVLRDLSIRFDGKDKFKADADFFRLIGKEHSTGNDEVEKIFQGIAARKIEEGKVVGLEIGSDQWIFNKRFFEKGMSSINQDLISKIKNSRKEVVRLVRKNMGLSLEDSNSFVDQNLKLGEFYDFEEGSYFVAYEHVGRIRVCASCGFTEEGSSDDNQTWYCSDTCQKTEDVCLSIRNKTWSDFVSESASTGFLLIEGGKAWSENHKIVAVGGQGHGFAAETANTKIDRFIGRDAQVVGDDNFKNGPDRLVDGNFIQTKYCRTGARSIGAAFDGQNGLFRYYDSAGNPMSIEVPKDQYNSAIKEMQRRIEDGKVPGIKNPESAKDLVRAGHLTYQQSVNITKFGTFESITYDAAEGAVVGGVAGGISFGITATIYYLNTNNPREAVKIAALQAGKTFGKSMAVYATTQQLHRIEVIQSVISKIDINGFSPGLRNAVQNGLRVNSKSAASKALGGTVVTAVSVIAVTTGPDLMKMINGRISGAQFAKNLGVATSGIGGGAIGAIAGGALGATLGPVGVWAGNVVGGVIGGMLASATANMFAKKFMKEDAEVVMEIITAQAAYLAKTFILTEKEIESLNMNLAKSITRNTMEVIFAEKNNRRAMANFFVKPIVVGVVRQRPMLQYSANDVIDVCAEMAA